MKPYLTEDHRRFRDQVRDFAEREVSPVATDLDRSGEFPWDTVKTMAEMGLFGVSVPRELGGLGLDYLSYVLAIEELARQDASHAITVSAHSTLAIFPILSFGTEEQQERYVPPLAGGRVLGGFGLTEAGAGSDAAGSRARALREDSGYRLNGAKIFITNAGVGEIFVVTAVTDPEAGTSGITSFIVCKPTVDPEEATRRGIGHLADLPFSDGVRAGEKEDKMGWRASDTRELLLEDVSVPENARLGEEGQGFHNFMKTLDAGRIGIAALSLGLAQGALDLGVRYSAGRSTVEGRLVDRQPVLFDLADLATQVEAGRHLTYHAAWLKENGVAYSKEASMAKLFCSELAMRATGVVTGILGPDGLSGRYPSERMFRDAKVCQIGEGTSEIQKLVIGRQLIADLG